MNRILCFFLLVSGGILITTGCDKSKKCICTSGGTYEIIDSALQATMGFPVPMVVFDSVTTKECSSLNYHDTTDIIYPAYGVVMNEFLTCLEK